MKYNKNNLFLCSLVSILLLVNFLFGCGQNHIAERAIVPVFYPTPPEKPRLQYLTSFSGPENLISSSTNAFEKFILGESPKQDEVVKPYGIALHDGKLYVCDVSKRVVEVFDLKNNKFKYLTTDNRLINPINIYITQDGTKYVSDPSAGAVFVFDGNDNLRNIIGKELGIAPLDVIVSNGRCYITDFNSNQVVAIDIITKQEILRFGEENTLNSISGNNLPIGQFILISDLAIDQQGNIYVTDKAAGRITKFDSSGRALATIGQLGSNIDDFVRPKGIAVDNENRIWVIDSAPEVAKIYDEQARLLLYFGLPGSEYGSMNLPAGIYLDYQNIEYFNQYAVPGADIEFIVLVSNQYGSNKINVYGFGSFPVSDLSASISNDYSASLTNNQSVNEIESNFNNPSISQTEPSIMTEAEQTNKTALLYYQSIQYYENGQFEDAKDGFEEVLRDNTIPADMANSIRQYILDINKNITTYQEKMENAELYYRTMSLYRTGQYEQARTGFVEVLDSGLIPVEMENSIKGYIQEIDGYLKNK